MPLRVKWLSYREISFIRVNESDVFAKRPVSIYAHLIGQIPLLTSHTFSHHAAVLHSVMANLFSLKHCHFLLSILHKS